MWLIVAQDGDLDARWLAGRLRARASRPVELIEAGDLVHDCRWEHRIGTGVTASRLVVGGDTVIDGGEVDGVLNRLSWLTAEGFEGVPRPDRDYATSELFALGMSWLESLGPRVLNQPAGFSLDGSWRTPAHWRALASSVGLPVVPYDSDHPDDAPPEPGRTVLVVDGQVIGTPAAPHRDRLAALQRACGLDIVEVCFGPGGAVSGVSFRPALRRYGQACVRAVLAALSRRAVLNPGSLS